MFSNFFFNRALYEIIWKNIAERSTTEMIIWRMRTACWITKATKTHSGCAIIIAFPLQQWLHELASILRYTFCLSCLLNFLDRATLKLNIFTTLIYLKR